MKGLLQISFIAFISYLFWFVFSTRTGTDDSGRYKMGINSYLRNAVDTPPDDTLPYKFNDLQNYETPPVTHSALQPRQPSNIKDTVIYDPATNTYTILQKVGNMDFRQPIEMSAKQYDEYEFNKLLRSYWADRFKADHTDRKSNKGFLGFNIPGLQKDGGIFGSQTIDIRPSGTAELIFGYKGNRRDDPSLTVKQRRYGNFDFQEKIQMNVQAKIGDKIDFGVKYNTESSFEFDNKIKLQYEGKEDEIIKKIEAGDVNLPLNSTLISGSQSLFGIKTQLQFGKATVTSVFSQQKSQTSNITVAGGAQVTEFSLEADKYEEKKHFFVSQYFYNNYNKFLKDLPIVNSPINITKMEVWVTNIGAATQENRNIVALMDVGEYDPYNTAFLPNLTPDAQYPSNRSNNIFDILNISSLRNINGVNSYLTGKGLENGIDFEKVENARKLSATEYSYNSKLGFISLNTTLNDDQVLAVAYQYTVLGSDSVYQVGEFSNGGVAAPSCLAVKLLKSTAINTKIPLWKLMMKNVYALGGYQINPEDFRLDVLYKSENLGVPAGYFTESNLKGIPLIRVLNMDNLNTNGDPEPDGVYDFIDNAATTGGTINAKNGRIYFPLVEPFGKDLRVLFDNPTMADKFCFDSLYTMTKTNARQYANKNRFSIAGRYKSSVGSEISLNAMNVPQGSVKVTAGGIMLVENVDYTVDYTLGRVKIINQGILSSGAPINISLENNSAFGMQTKTFMGTHVDYRFNKNLVAGATILNLTERPFTYKVNIGDEPISNTIWGMNVSYQTESQLITKLVDFLPFISTKSPSKVSIDAEFANLIPGHSRAIGKTGTAYIDDFEGSKSSIDIKNVGTWFLSSVPQGQPMLFPEAADDSLLSSGFNRAKLAWYVIDPSVFFRDNSLRPSNITDVILSNHYQREVLETEVFPKKENANNIVTNIPVLDLAFYPKEKGPYNYDVNPTANSSGIDAQGRLNDPETRWGGIMRKIETPDFEENNVEYIEFWMMDPFIYNQNSSGGKLIFNLGDISEDVLRDHRKSYENGLPTSAEVVNVDTTQWGRVPIIQALVNSFDNVDASREFQDVGLDGLRTADEQAFFAANYLNTIATVYGTGSQAYQNAMSDPSNDNYHYFRGGDYDSQSLNILQRYKKFNNMDGNSPTTEQSPEDYPTSATTQPNIEDINRDNTLSESERYYQYVVNLNPNNMNIGENYISDIYTATVKLKDQSTASVKWYQFKIPVKTPDQVIGNIQDFKSIRFIRTFLYGFSDSVILRFATLDLVRSQWRRYDYSLLAPGEFLPGDDQNLTSFDISAVNLEENGSRQPIPYVLPPGINRETNYASTTLQKLNEQSLSLKICHLIDGDARAIYKTTDFDIRYYKRLKLFVHSEVSKQDEYNFQDGDLTVFVRLGTDFTNNYYEYEIPLHPTPLGSYGEDDASRQRIWPDSIDLELQKLVDLKMNRNAAMRSDGSNISLLSQYVQYDGANKMTIMGVPNLSDVRTIMIGIRNPKKSTINTADDGNPKCAEIWVNELRLTNFKEDGGWAATTRISADLADLGNVMLAGNVSTAGFGSIEKKVSQRQLENMASYDAAANVQLGKLLPPSLNLRIPMHVDYSEAVANPQYNPLDPDIYLRDDLKTYASKAERDSIRNIVQTYTRRKGINFVNVKKEKNPNAKNTKIKVYDLSNFDVTYSYNEIFQRDIDIEYNVKKTYRGALGYNYNNNPKNYMPFNKVKIFNKKPFKLIKDFNFYLLPKSMSFMTNLDRGYEENLYRNKSEALILIEPTYLKTFNWNRNYSLKYDITKSLKLDYIANANARVDEPAGRIDRADSDYKFKRDSIWRSIMNLGRMTNFTQSLKANYSLPINKIPLLEWTSISLQYSGDYTWTAAPLYKDSTGQYTEHPFGNTIMNNQSISANFNGNLVNLYNNINYLKKLNQENNQKKSKTNALLDTTKKEETPIAKIILDNFLRFLMMAKNVSASYTVSNGTVIPGFRGKPVVIGMDLDNNVPGWGFVFGSQKDIRHSLVNANMLTRDSMLNNPFQTKHNENMSARMSLEPAKSLKIELTATRNYSLNHVEYYRFNETDGFRSFSPQDNGSFSISIITWKTAFVKDSKDFSNATFEQFKAIRPEVAQLVAEQSSNWDGTYFTDSISGKQYPTGYGPTSQSVLIPAFLATYTSKGAAKYAKNLFPTIPIPNWRLTYNGLTSLEFFKKLFNTLNLSHAYRSTYNVGGFTGNVLFNDPDQDGFTTVRDAVNNYLPKYEIAQVSITEQFSPFIGIDMTWKNSLITKFEYKKSRNLSLSFANNQMTEVISNEITIGTGYRFKDVLFIFKTGGGRKTLKSDLNLKADLSIRDNKTILRRIVESNDQISAGQRVVSINISADYQISQKFTVRAFFDKVINNPYMVSQFFNTNTNAGISLRFSLAQ